MLDAKMTAPHIKLCIAFGSNVKRKKDGSTYLNYVSYSALMVGAKKTDSHIKLCIVFSYTVTRNNEGSTY